MLELFMTAVIDRDDETRARAVLKGICARDGYESMNRCLRFQGPRRPTGMSNLVSVHKSDKDKQPSELLLWRELQTAVSRQSYLIDLRYEVPYDGFGPQAQQPDFNANEGILRWLDFPDPPPPNSNRAITTRKKIEIWKQKNLLKIMQDNNHALKGELLEHTVQYFDDSGIEYCLCKQYLLKDRSQYQPMLSPDTRPIASHLPAQEALECGDPMGRWFLFVKINVLEDTRPHEITRAAEKLQVIQRELEGAIEFKHFDRRTWDPRVPLEVRSGPAPLPQVVTVGDN
ncbi:hypothetical protein CFIMG_002902RA [Ceratocystis fimbriata CBS 114723]|uniref:Mediator of RNA polymerase II transcription subunit 18 n=1 Tax=Ceratocystis fimbriata CBS 114723 TaxID=1035309 RepID=A0A2C5XFZ5_9PEZI|nr:hypothetical protein CFIMG_002902RA [Ceratocystis fimbriata CBS 114723]